MYDKNDAQKKETSSYKDLRLVQQIVVSIITDYSRNKSSSLTREFYPRSLVSPLGNSYSSLDTLSAKHSLRYNHFLSFSDSFLSN